MFCTRTAITFFNFALFVSLSLAGMLANCAPYRLRQKPRTLLVASALNFFKPVFKYDA